MSMNWQDVVEWHKFPASLIFERATPLRPGHLLYIIQAIVKDVSARTGADGYPPVVFHIQNTAYLHRWRKGDLVPMEFIFFDRDEDWIHRWREALGEKLGTDEYGNALSAGDIGPVQIRKLSSLESEYPPLPAEGEIDLEFLSPLPFSLAKGKPRTFLGKEYFIGSLEKRFSHLFGMNISYRSDRDDFVLLPYFWDYTETREASLSQPGAMQYINGCCGKLYLRGRFEDFMPFLLLGSEVHAGSKLAYSQGYYTLHPDSEPFFRCTFPR
jgi:hypothetical protein